MSEKTLKETIDEIILDAFKRVKYAYQHHCEPIEGNVNIELKENSVQPGYTRLVFPRYSKKNDQEMMEINGGLRISEQELRFAFVEAINAYCTNNRISLYYSIETPTKHRYSGFSSKKDAEKRSEPILDIEDGRSAEFDMVIFDNNMKRVCLIEFKAHNALEKDYWKDLLKLNEEKQNSKGHEVLCYFINLFKSYDKGTVNNIRAKYHRFFIENRKYGYKLDNVFIWWYALESPNIVNGEVMNDLFMMDNLHQEDTGIDAVIYVTHKWPKRDPFVIAWLSANNKVSISIEDKPKVLEPDKLSDDISDVIQWIRLNKTLLLEYWNNDLYPTSKMLSEIEKLDINLS